MPAWGLVMPFVTVASVGGPHDDEAYVAGYEMGALAVRLQMAELLGLPVGLVTVRSENVAQLDLLAMRFGFVMLRAGEVAEVEGWSTVELLRAAS